MKRCEECGTQITRAKQATGARRGQWSGSSSQFRNKRFCSLECNGKATWRTGRCAWGVPYTPTNKEAAATLENRALLKTYDDHIRHQARKGRVWRWGEYHV